MSWARRPFEVSGETAVQENAVLACVIQHAAHDSREQEAAGSPQVPCCLGRSHRDLLLQKLRSDFFVEGREKPVAAITSQNAEHVFPWRPCLPWYWVLACSDKILRIAFLWAGLGARSPCVTHILWAMCS